MSHISQTLDIVEEHPDKFRVVALAAGSNVDLLAQQVGNQATVLPCGASATPVEAVRGI